MSFYKTTFISPFSTYPPPIFYAICTFIAFTFIKNFYIFYINIQQINIYILLLHNFIATLHHFNWNLKPPSWYCSFSAEVYILTKTSKSLPFLYHIDIMESDLLDEVKLY